MKWEDKQWEYELTHTYADSSQVKKKSFWKNIMRIIVNYKNVYILNVWERGERVEWNDCVDNDDVTGAKNNQKTNFSFSFQLKPEWKLVLFIVAVFAVFFIALPYISSCSSF